MPAASRSRERGARSSFARPVLARAVLAAALALIPACNLTAGPRGLDATGPFLVPPPVSEQRALPPFASLYVDGPLDVEVRVGTPCSVRFTGDEGRLAELVAEVRDGTLLVRADPGAPWRDGPRALVTLPDLVSITSAGGGWVAVTGLDAARIEVRLRGSGDVRLRGRVGELVADDTGAGRIDASELEVGAAPAR